MAVGSCNNKGEGKSRTATCSLKNCVGSCSVFSSLFLNTTDDDDDDNTGGCFPIPKSYLIAVVFLVTFGVFLLRIVSCCGISSAADVAAIVEGSGGGIDDDFDDDDDDVEDRNARTTSNTDNATIIRGRKAHHDDADNDTLFLCVGLIIFVFLRTRILIACFCFGYFIIMNLCGYGVVIGL